MNSTLSTASELIQHEVNKYFHLKEGELLNPVGIFFIQGEVRILTAPHECDPESVLYSIKKVNCSIPSDVCGMACEVFFKTNPNMKDYKYGEMNESNAESAIMLFLQERLSKEKYIAVGKLDKKDNSIISWMETGSKIGGDMYEMDLYE